MFLEGVMACAYRRSVFIPGGRVARQIDAVIDLGRCGERVY